MQFAFLYCPVHTFYNMKSCVFLFFLLTFFSETPSNAFADPVNVQSQDPKGSEGQCNGYCFSVFKPLLDHFVELKEGANASEELRMHANSLISTNKDLQSQLAVAEVQVKYKSELITQKDEQLKDKNELIIMKNNEIQNQSEQIKTMKDEIKSLRNQTKRKEECEFEVPLTKDGWIIIQKRFDGSVDFNRSWADYKKGFGDIHGEFFIGLEKLHLLTERQHYELSIRLGAIDGATGYANYDDFEIGSEKESYYLKSVGNYSGTAGDSLTLHKKMKFTTFDRNNSVDSRIYELLHNGWWLEEDTLSSLNGKYFKDGKALQKNGIYWGHFQNGNYTVSLTFTEMMIRPKPLQGD